MKKAALLAAALAMVLSLAACGNRDNNSNPDNPGSTVTDNNGTGTNNGTVPGSSSGVNNGAVTGNNNGTNNGTVPGSSGANNGTTAGNNGSLTDNNGIGTGSTAGADNGAVSRAGGALRRAADDVGDAVTGLVDGGRSAVARGTSTTTFQRMLDNAHIHDTDGVLTDGENSRW